MAGRNITGGKVAGARAHRGEPREGVQERDHDRHVGAPDRKDEENSERERDDDERVGPNGLLGDARPDARSERSREQQPVQRLLADEGQRPAGHELLELGEGHEASAEGDRPNEGREEGCAEDVTGEGAVGRCEPAVLVDRDEDGSAAPEAVEDGHHLRHGGHLHLPRRDESDDGADREAGRDEPVVGDLRQQDREHDGDDHADRRQHVSGARRGRGREALDADDEEDRGDDVHERRVQEGGHTPDELEAEEDREREDRDRGDQGGGHARASVMTRPPCATHVPRTISSSKSSSSSPSRTRSERKDWTFREYIWLACTGIVAGTFVRPTIVTPPETIVSPGLVAAQLPPASAARSTITEPARMPPTPSSVMSSGAGRPGTSAVVMTASDSAAWRAISSCSRACWSSARATA